MRALRYQGSTAAAIPSNDLGLTYAALSTINICAKYEVHGV
jgi:hypothetical protein